MSSGIYAIINTVNNKCYIGSAKNFTDRWGKHKRDLLRKTHHSKYLQNSYNKYGKGVFEFKILEEVPKEEIIDNLYLTDLEQIYLDTYRPDYNIAKFARSCRGIIRSEETKAKLKLVNVGNKYWLGRKHKEESKKKMSIARSGEKHCFYGKKRPDHAKAMTGRTISEESKIKISEFHKGKKYFLGKSHSKESKEKMSLIYKEKQWKVKYEYKFKSPEGEEYTFLNMRQFCRDHNLHQAAMQRVTTGVYKQHKGWTMIEIKEV